MKMGKRSAFVPMAILMCVLGLSVVYAATAGSIVFNGTAIVSPSANAVFGDTFLVENLNPRSTFDVSADGKTITFTAHVDTVDNVAMLMTHIKNVGALPIILEGVEASSDFPMGLSFMPPYIAEPIRLESGQTSGPLNLRVVMSPTLKPPTPPGIYTFQATINYTEAAA